VSFNPPEKTFCSVADFKEAIEAVEQKLGLSGQPRAIVFHEKEGRRHAHVVWSRIDAVKMRAVNMAHYKSKLQDISRELYQTHDWDMPEGFQNKEKRDLLNYSHTEYHQAKRQKVDPKDLKALLKKCW